MTHPLDGARLKIIRAEEHLQSLIDTIAQYVQSDPYEMSVKQDHKLVTMAFNLTSDPDPRISAIIGDCLHNLRSALDYVMWELAGTYAGRVLVAPPVGSDKPYFPLFNKVASFQKSVKSALGQYKIPAPIIQEIAAVQPYNAGYECLDALHLLSNVDKHRLPLLVYASTESIRWRVNPSLGGSTLPPQLPAVIVDHPQDKNQASIFVSWQDVTMPREPVEWAIADMLKCVAGVVPRFDKFIL